MIRLVVAVLVLALAWMVWWAIGHTAYQKGLEAWVGARRADGWTVEYKELVTRGFPNRFDTTLSDLQLTDPVTGIGWSAPFVQILSLSYKPHQAILLLPPEHVVSLPDQRVTISQTRAEGSVFLEPSPMLALDRLRVVIRALGAASTAGWNFTLDETRLAAEKLAATEAGYRVGAEILGIGLPAPAFALLDPAAHLPPTLEQIRLDAKVEFTHPWDRSALEGRHPRIESIDLTEASVRWGDIRLRAEGALLVDGIGQPEGKITLYANDWRSLYELAAGFGLSAVHPKNGAVEMLDTLSGFTEVIGVPLIFEDGQVRLGPIALGPAPRFAIP